ncbi:ZBT21 protein, partial [Atractosteus spatula]|nr:ZBT21 protein [Atractosteus spatula]
MEGLLHYINPAHAISLLSHLNEQRLKGHLCDVVLIVGDQKFRAHKSVLAASSEYFQTLFTRKDSEARGAVQLDFCEPDAFENVLNYIYSSSLFVERDGLAAVQELGYSLGIPFLTNILSKKPHVSYSGTRKRASFCEEDDNGSQQRSVIVCQSRGDKPGPSASQDKGPNPASQAASNPFPPVKPKEVSPGQPAGGSSQPKSTDAAEGPDRRPSRSGALVQGRSPTRPQLTASLSFNDSCLQQGGEAGGDVAQAQDRAPTCLAKQGLRALPGRAGQERQGVDRSGPLIKSLLRRSLSMDSPVPVCSPAFDLKSAHSREEAVTKPGSGTAAAAESVEGKRFKDKSNVVPPLSLRSGILSRYREAEVDKSEVRVKTEPSSPLADPSEIIRVTVGDNLPVNFRDFHPHANDEAPRGFSKHSVKRKSRLDSRRNQFKKSRCVEDRDFGSELSRCGATPHNSDTDEDAVPAELCSEKLPSPAEQGEHERECRHATVCSYCSLRFSTLALKKEHEDHCEYKKLTCLECMRTFKSSFSIWRHQVEVHNQNTMTIKEQLSLSLQEHNGEAPDPLRPSAPGSEPKSAGSSKEEAVFSDSSEPPQFDSEDSSFLPEDLSVPQRLEEVRVKEEPPEEAAVDEAPRPPAEAGPEESCVWPCEKCGKLFTARKQLERHQELLCHVKPFICHICNKAFRTNFRLWSHAETAEEPLTPQESDTLFYHAPTLSALTFKRQYMCKLCHRTFKTAFSLWSHEQSHTST